MTDDLTDAERDARDSVLLAVVELQEAQIDGAPYLGTSAQDAAIENALDRYRTAILASRDTAWRAAIEGMRKPMPDLRHDDRTRYSRAGWDAALSALTEQMESK